VGRVRTNATVRLHRRSGTDFSGNETTTIAVGRARARVKFTSETIVSPDGMVTVTDGTIVFEPSTDVRRGDLLQILDGPYESKAKRYRIESVDEDLTVTGRVVARRAAVTFDKGREGAV